MGTKPSEPNKSWAMEVIADGSGQWAGNAVRFATKEEALAYADFKFMTWTLVQKTRVVESTDEVNYRWDDKTGLKATSPSKEG